MLGGVATAAGERCMLAVEYVAGLAVIETLGRGIPVDHVEIFSIVIRVTLDARRAGSAGQGIGRVQPVVALDLGSNFAMTFRAAKRGGAQRGSVALDAVGRTVEALVRARQGAGRNLSMSGERE